jgi:hypothetical protein
VPHWISDLILSIVNWVPAWIVEEGSPKFTLIRAMFGLLLIILIVYLIAMRPFRSGIARCWRTIRGMFARDP